MPSEIEVKIGAKCFTQSLASGYWPRRPGLLEENRRLRSLAVLIEFQSSLDSAGIIRLQYVI